MKKINKGILIVIEGIDGSGKSLLIKNLGDMLKKENIPYIKTKEPGGSPLGNELRSILQEQPQPICPKAEYLLFAADRAQHIEELIKPAITEKKVILCDRMGDSSIIYQGYGRGLNIDMIQKINQWALNGVTPDITFYVKIDINTAFQRMKKRNEQLTAFEKEKKTFFEKLIHGYAELYKNRHDVITLDGNQAPDAMAQEAFSYITSYIE